MKLSIITVNKNNAAGLERTIQSVINQTFKDFEYIIIDGASTDGSVDVIKKYEDKIDYWVSEPDTGIYNAMNKGIRVAKGEYLLFLNSGDHLVNNTILEEVFKLNFNEDIVYGDALIDNSWIKSYPDNITLKFFINNFLPHQSTFFKRAIFINVGYYNENYKLISDLELYLKAIVIKNCSYKHLKKVISVYYTDGISIKNIELRNLERIKVFYNLFPRIYPDYVDFLEIERKYNLLMNSTLIKLALKILNNDLYIRLKKWINHWFR